MRIDGYSYGLTVFAGVNIRLLILLLKLCQSTFYQSVWFEEKEVMRLCWDAASSTHKRKTVIWAYCFQKSLINPLTLLLPGKIIP